MVGLIASFDLLNGIGVEEETVCEIHDNNCDATTSALLCHCARHFHFHFHFEVVDGCRCRRIRRVIFGSTNDLQSSSFLVVFFFHL